MSDGLDRSNMALPAGTSLMSGLAWAGHSAFALYPMARTQAVAVAMAFYRGARQDAYNILWAVVFGFATLNILSLAARRYEPTRRGLSFGELVAVMVVLIAVFLLGWEMLNLFHVFPIKLRV